MSTTVHRTQVHKRRVRQLFAALLACALLLGGYRPAEACGPFFLNAVFTFTIHPDLPLERFTRGELGVLQPTYARSYLYAAYRQMHGMRFNPGEQSALAELWKQRLTFGGDDREATSSVQKWLDARKQVAGAGAAPTIEVYRSREKPNEYESYLNCQRDAFETAAATLAERARKFGADSPAVKAWVEAQDMVFANCHEGQNIPAPLDASADPLLRADRAYQIAAANFYAARHDEARRLFEEISRDTSSPWRARAPYLVARSLLRKASLGEESARAGTLAEAEKQLRIILAENSVSPLQDDARRLLNLVRLRLRPAEKLRELAGAIMRAGSQQTLKQDVWDYTLLLDKFYGEDSLAEEAKFKQVSTTGREDDLTDWVVTFQVQDADAREHALERWQQTRSDAWLVAALSKSEGTQAQASSLVEAAARVKPDAPAFASATFHALRLLIEAGRETEARTRLDALLPAQGAALPPSALNLLLGQRMTLARDLTEFLQFAQRVPTAYSYDEDGRQLPQTDEELAQDETFKSYARGRRLFDADAAAAFNNQFPLALLRQAAVSRALPDTLRREVAVAAWVRSVMLDDRESGKELAPVVESLVPELKGYLDAELSAPTNEARKFAAVYALLKFPGLRPYVAGGIGRTTPVGKIDDYRDNWWCDRKTQLSPRDASGDDDADASKDKPAQAAPRPLSFIDAAQQAAAERENARLAAAGTAPDYLTRLAIEWADKSPEDPRVPEALHLAVKTTRYGCTDEQTPALSKAAFQLLHKRYPKSEWAKKTPYWFKNT